MATITASAAGGNWNTNGAWVGGVQPSAGDDVLLTAASGNITITASTACNSLNCTGYTGTLTHNAGVNLTIGTSATGLSNVGLLLVAGMTYTLGNAATSALIFASTNATAQTITTGGKTLGNVTFQGVGSTYTLQDANSIGGTIAHNNGTLNTNGQTCTWALFISTSTSTRTLTLGASAITCTGNTWAYTQSTGLTITTNTATVTFTGTALTITGGASGLNWNTSFILNVGLICTISRADSFTNLTYAPPSTGLFLSIGAGLTIANTLTITGRAAPARCLIQSNTLASSRTITCNGTVTASLCDFQDIHGAGTASWDLHAISGGAGDCGGNTGIIFTAPQNNYYFRNTGNYSTAANWFLATNGGGGAGRVPLPQDSAIFDANSFSTTGQTINLDCPRISGTSFVGVLNSPTIAVVILGTTTQACYGSLALGGLTFAPNIQLSLSGRNASPFTLSCGGGNFNFGTNVTVSVGANYKLGDNLVLGSGFTVAGTLDNTSVNANVTAGIIIINAGTVSLGSGTWTATQSSNAWVSEGGATINAGTSTILLASPSTTSITFAGAGATYHTVQVMPGVVAPILITGANTFANLIVPAGVPVIFPHGVTQTISTAGGWQVNGSNFGYERLPGLAANYCSAPSSSALSITGDIDLRFQGSLPSWSSTSSPVFLAKGWTSGTAQFVFFIGAAGALSLRISTNGTTYAINVLSTANVPFTANQVGWVRVTWSQSLSQAKFYTSTDGITWTQLGTTVTATASAIFTSSAVLELGSQNTGASNPLLGNMYRAQVYNGIAGTLVFDANFTAKPFGANTFTESSTNAATVTINGQQAQSGDGRVLIASDLAASTATISVASGTVVSWYVTLQDNTATGGATFETDLASSVFISNVHGWNQVAWTATLAGTFTAAAAGVTTIPATGSLAGTFTAAATGSIVVPATGALTGTFTGSASGTVIIHATGSLLGEFTASGSGVVVIVGATGSLSGEFDGEGAGATVLAATGSLMADFLATGTGEVDIPATGSLSAEFDAAASATIEVPASGSLVAEFTASGSAGVIVPAAGALIGEFTGAANGQVIVHASGSLAGVFTAEANAFLLPTQGIASVSLSAPSAIVVFS